jgi:hypothetical protein
MASLRISLLLIAILVSLASSLPAGNTTNVCQEIENSVSISSAVLYQCKLPTTSQAAQQHRATDETTPASTNFTSDIHHWFDSSSQIPGCVLEVGSAKDTSIAVRMLWIVYHMLN